MTNETSPKTCQVEMHDGQPCGRPVYNDEDVCICHSENPEKDVDGFNAEVKKVYRSARERGPFDFTGFVFPTDYISPKAYSGEAVFRNATFLGVVDFFGCRFSNLVDCSEVKFFGKAEFGGAEFSGKALFIDARFNEEATFVSVKFFGEARFILAQFRKAAHFDSAKFCGSAYFNAAKFSGVAGFQSAEFSVGSNFFNSRFSGVANFLGCQLGETARLEFDGERFRNYRGTIFAKLANFTNITPGPLSGVCFRMTDLSKCLFLETDVTRFEFIDCTWHRIPKCFKWSPRNAVYDEVAEREGIPHYPLLAQLYRRLQANHINNYQYSEAGDFYIGEQEMVRKGQGPIQQYLSVNFLYKLASYYGQNYWLPLFWLAVALVLFPLLFVLDGVKFNGGEINYEFGVWSGQFFLFNGDYWNCFFRNLSFCSFSRTGLNDFILEPYQSGVLVAEMVCVITFVTLFLLALRRQYKRKSF